MGTDTVAMFPTGFGVIELVRTGINVLRFPGHIADGIHYGGYPQRRYQTVV